MKTSIATVSISGDLKEKLAAIAAAGFDGVEIFENDFLTSDLTPAELGRMVRDQGLEITLFQPFRDFEGMPEPQRRRNFDRAERKFDLMGELGTELMLICSNVSPVSLGGIDRAAADFRELGDRAARHGIRVGYEALAWGRHVSDHRDAWEIVRRADHPQIGLILDSFHTLSRRIDVNSIRAIPGDRIFIVQLADAPLFDMDLLYWSRHFRNMPGEGELDVTGFMAAVAATGYDGPLSLEIFNDQFRAGSPRSIAGDGHRSLLHLMDQVRRSEPDIRIPAAAMPERIAIHGIAFVEFAVGPDEDAELASHLNQLGFHRAGRHRFRDVDLYRQGEIRIVVNRESSGFAHSSYVVHGSNAYAMGLLVEDASEAMARASALDARIFSEPRREGELTIPAIEGVDGGVIYFLDASQPLADVWAHEFEPLAAPAANAVAGAGLLRFDHVAQTMDFGDMLSCLLFYTSIFRLRRTALVDVVDPGGLVRSQAVESDDGRMRVTLNGAENRKTFAGRFLADNFGSGIQHVAFATDDIFRTAERLEALGFQTLAISRNYFDDLEARFGLDPDFADRLRARNIFYDRDEAGEYFQIYSRTFGDSFFFEIVERRAEYRGYGAANAQFRIAAQRRNARPAGLPVQI